MLEKVAKALVAACIGVVVLSVVMGLGRSAAAESQGCAPGQHAWPISITRALAAVRRQGFSAFVDSASPCPQQIAGQISNILFRGPHANVAEHDEVQRSEGFLACEVDRRPAPAEANDPSEIKSYKIPSNGVELVMANIACRLYADAANRAKRVSALRRALQGM
jgi:hypothetical protein